MLLNNALDTFVVRDVALDTEYPYVPLIILSPVPSLRTSDSRHMHEIDAALAFKQTDPGEQLHCN